MNIINNYSTTIVSIFQDVINNYERNLEIIKQAEEELMDLEHEIELSAPKDMYKGYLVYKEVRDVRIKGAKPKRRTSFSKICMIISKASKDNHSRIRFNLFRVRQ